MIENKGIKNIKNKENLKNFQLSYSKFLLSFINKNVLNNLLFKFNIFPKTERLTKRKKKTISKYKWKVKKEYTFIIFYIIKKLL